MNFADTLRGLWRRWYIVLPGMVIAASLAIGAWSLIPPGYERSSTQLLIPGAASIPDGANPYLFLGGLAPAADVVVRAVGSENLLNEVVAENPGVKIEVSRDTTTAGPVILIVVTAATDKAAEEVLGLLVERTATELDALQETENIPVVNRMTVLPITVDSQSILQERSRFIAAGAAGLVGLALTLFVAGLVDGFSLQRRRGGDPDGADAPSETLDAASMLHPEPASTPEPSSASKPSRPRPARTSRPTTVLGESSTAGESSTEIEPEVAASPLRSRR